MLEGSHLQLWQDVYPGLTVPSCHMAACCKADEDTQLKPTA
jgi:hypothetical protein